MFSSGKEEKKSVMPAKAPKPRVISFLEVLDEDGAIEEFKFGMTQPLAAQAQESQESTRTSGGSTPEVEETKRFKHQGKFVRVNKLRQLPDLDEYEFEDQFAENLKHSYTDAKEGMKSSMTAASNRFQASYERTRDPVKAYNETEQARSAFGESVA